MAKHVIKTNINADSCPGVAFVSGIHRPTSSLLFCNLKDAKVFPSKGAAERYFKKYNTATHGMPVTATVELLNPNWSV